jgi:hypothetical protein
MTEFPLIVLISAIVNSPVFANITRFTIEEIVERVSAHSSIQPYLYLTSLPAQVDENHHNIAMSLQPTCMKALLLRLGRLHLCWGVGVGQFSNHLDLPTYIYTRP